MIKLIALDLDKTLLNSNGKISSFSINILQKCQEANYKIIVATGRSETATMYALERYRPDALICNNGALLIIGKQRYNKFIPRETSRQIVKYFSDKSYIKTIKITTADGEYSNQTNIEKNGVIYTYYDFAQQLDKDVYKIMINCDNFSCKEFVDKFHCKCEPVRNGNNYIITGYNVNKAMSITSVAQYFNISMGEVLAFGDDVNDIEMLLSCGVGVAMENAIDKVKEKADFICKSNDQDGATKWVEKNLL